MIHSEDKTIYRWIIIQMLNSMSWYLSWIAQIELSKYLKIFLTVSAQSRLDDLLSEHRWLNILLDISVAVYIDVHLMLFDIFWFLISVTSKISLDFFVFHYCLLLFLVTPFWINYLQLANRCQSSLQCSPESTCIKRDLLALGRQLKPRHGYNFSKNKWLKNGSLTVKD